MHSKNEIPTSRPNQLNRVALDSGLGDGTCTSNRNELGLESFIQGECRREGSRNFAMHFMNVSMTVPYAAQISADSVL